MILNFVFLAPICSNIINRLRPDHDGCHRRYSPAAGRGRNRLTICDFLDIHDGVVFNSSLSTSARVLVYRTWHHLPSVHSLYVPALDSLLDHQPERRLVGNTRSGDQEDQKGKISQNHIKSYICLLGCDFRKWSKTRRMQTKQRKMPRKAHCSVFWAMVVALETPTREPLSSRWPVFSKSSFASTQLMTVKGSSSHELPSRSTLLASALKTLKGRHQSVISPWIYRVCNLRR